MELGTLNIQIYIITDKTTTYYLTLNTLNHTENLDI